MMNGKRQSKSRKPISPRNVASRSPVLTRSKGRMAKKINDDATRCLELLSRELPDFELQLYPQAFPIDRPALFPTFTCFPCLPIEVREMVWFETFPKRQMINLLGYLSHRPSSRAKVPRQSQTGLPISLSVNTEARAFTLKHYHLLIANSNDSDFKYQTSWKRIIYIDPRVDQVWVNMEQIIFERPSCAKFCLQYADCLSQIKNLEVRNSFWSKECEQDLWLGCGGVLKYFHRLEVIHMVSPRRLVTSMFWDLQAHDVWAKEAQLEAMRDFFSAFQFLFWNVMVEAGARTVPEIFLYHNRAMIARSDHDQHFAMLFGFLAPIDDDIVITWVWGADVYNEPLYLTLKR